MNTLTRTDPGLAVGDPVSYGLWDGRQIPCTVTKLDRKTRLPSVLEVRETIPYLCKQGARITLEPDFWEGLTP
jgi:hypothetical protein